MHEIPIGWAMISGERAVKVPRAETIVRWMTTNTGRAVDSCPLNNLYGPCEHGYKSLLIELKMIDCKDLEASMTLGYYWIWPPETLGDCWVVGWYDGHVWQTLPDAHTLHTVELVKIGPRIKSPYGTSH